MQGPGKACGVCLQPCGRVSGQGAHDGGREAEAARAQPRSRAALPPGAPLRASSQTQKNPPGKVFAQTPVPGGGPRGCCDNGRVKHKVATELVPRVCARPNHPALRTPRGRFWLCLCVSGAGWGEGGHRGVQPLSHSLLKSASPWGQWAGNHWPSWPLAPPAHLRGPLFPQRARRLTWPTKWGRRRARRQGSRGSQGSWEVPGTPPVPLETLPQVAGAQGSLCNPQWPLHAAGLLCQQQSHQGAEDRSLKPPDGLGGSDRPHSRPVHRWEHVGEGPSPTPSGRPALPPESPDPDARG